MQVNEMIKEQHEVVRRRIKKSRNNYKGYLICQILNGFKDKKLSAKYYFRVKNGYEKYISNVLEENYFDSGLSEFIEKEEEDIKKLETKIESVLRKGENDEI